MRILYIACAFRGAISLIEFKEITEENYDECLKLSVLDNQKNFVTSNVYSLAQARVYYDTAFPFAIYADDTMVGFIMMSFYKPKSVYGIWRLMIDKHYQGKGYGRASVLLAIKYLKDRFNAKGIFLAIELDNIVAEKLYSGVGFQRTGEIEDNQIVMRFDTTK